MGGFLTKQKKANLCGIIHEEESARGCPLSIQPAIKFVVFTVPRVLCIGMLRIHFSLLCVQQEMASEAHAMVDSANSILQDAESQLAYATEQQLKTKPISDWLTAEEEAEASRKKAENAWQSRSNSLCEMSQEVATALEYATAARAKANEVAKKVTEQYEVHVDVMFHGKLLSHKNTLKECGIRIGDTLQFMPAKKHVQHGFEVCR